MTFYHGTSIQCLTKILPPTETSILREDFRKKFLDCVFITPLKKSAEMYAKKCASKLGGTPIVYEVRPINPMKIRKFVSADKTFSVSLNCQTGRS